MAKRVLVVAAHPDDEVLGCGGTIARHVAEGDTVQTLFLADGVSSRPGSQSTAVRHRLDACEQARKILGITSSTFFGLPDNRLDSLPLIEIIKPLEALVGEYAPQIIYTHHAGDLNVDHRIAHQAILTACRPAPGISVREIYTFEVMSSTEWSSPGIMPFIPNHFVDISAYVETKHQALGAYATEMRATPHSRSVENLMALARHRGSAVGLDAAEGFVVVRSVL